MPDTNPLERLNKEVKRRADVVGIFPCEASITRLDMPPESGGLGSERHAAARMPIPSMPALASVGVR